MLPAYQSLAETSYYIFTAILEAIEITSGLLQLSNIKVTWNEIHVNWNNICNVFQIDISNNSHFSLKYKKIKKKKILSKQKTKQKNMKITKTVSKIKP